MKKYIVIAILLFAFFSNAQKQTNSFLEASEIASSSNKKILLIFAGSDWCAPCIKLDRLILQTDEFKNLANENYVYYKADFPMRKKNKLSEEKTKENSDLAEKHKQNGTFPLIVVLNSDQKELGRISYKDVSPKEYFNLINSF